ncbi:MAG TPA: GntR family transcriptional regulator [Streptosporangiaceae bacterium]|jgi:DNA-binding GntR family transcriptional regulator
MSTSSTVRSVAAQNVSAVDLVTAEIRRSILTGALPAGEQFSIRELARQLGVSHIPVREALRLLESQGLIVLSHTRSASVASLSIEDITAIYRLRLRIEPDLAARSVPLQTPDLLRQAEAALKRSRSAGPDLAWRAHCEFHERLIAPVATEWDLRIMHTLWRAAERYTLLVFDPTTIDQAERQRRYDRHAGLLRIAVAGNGPALEAALTAHLTFNEAEIEARIRRLAAPGSP